MLERNHKLIANYFRIASIIGIALLLGLQFLWFKNAYEMVDQEMMEKCKISLKEAVDKETFGRIDNLPDDLFKKDINDKKGYEIVAEGNADKPEDLMIGINEFLYTIGNEISLYTIDSIFINIMKYKLNYIPEFNLEVIQDTIILNNLQIKDSLYFNRILEKSSKTKNVNLEGKINRKNDNFKNHEIRLRINSKQILCMVVEPTSIIFIDKARFLLLGSVIIVLLIGFIMISQLRTVLRERRFVQFIKEFTSSITHDLQTPMNNISMAIEILSLGKLDNDVKLRENYFRICKEQSERQISNIRKIMILAKSEQSFLTIEKSRIKLKDYLENILENYRKGILYSNKNVKINLDCSPENLEVNIDADLFESVMNNLIDNAIKYSYENVEIEIYCIEVDNSIQIKVKDHGLGISAQNLEKIFKYLDRGSQVENKRIIGYGIGLSFVEKIINAHSGSISVNSIEDVGSEFIILLPKS